MKLVRDACIILLLPACSIFIPPEVEVRPNDCEIADGVLRHAPERDVELPGGGVQVAFDAELPEAVRAPDQIVSFVSNEGFGGGWKVRQRMMTTDVSPNQRFVNGQLNVDVNYRLQWNVGDGEKCTAPIGVRIGE